MFNSLIEPAVSLRSHPDITGFMLQDSAHKIQWFAALPSAFSQWVLELDEIWTGDSQKDIYSSRVLHTDLYSSVHSSV